MSKNQNVSSREIAKIRKLADFDMIMLISEIHDHGWEVARNTLRIMPPGAEYSPAVAAALSKALREKK